MCIHVIVKKTLLLAYCIKLIIKIHIFLTVHILVILNVLNFHEKCHFFSFCGIFGNLTRCFAPELVSVNAGICFPLGVKENKFEKKLGKSSVLYYLHVTSYKIIYTIHIFHLSKMLHLNNSAD